MAVLPHSRAHSQAAERRREASQLYVKAPPSPLIFPITLASKRPAEVVLLIVWQGPPREDLQPQRLLVDYVRVYRQAASSRD
jgi:hypothetical protein